MLRRLLLSVAAVCALTAGAAAQTSPNFAFKQVPSATQWNQLFAGKVDYPGVFAAANVWANTQTFNASTLFNATATFGANGGNAATLILNGSTSGSSSIAIDATGTIFTNVPTGKNQNWQFNGVTYAFMNSAGFNLGAIGASPGELVLFGSTSGSTTEIVGATGALTITTPAMSIDGTAPTSCSSTGSGSGATCAFGTGSNNSNGTAVITAGTTASASGTLTINFSVTIGTNVPDCQFGFDDSGTAWSANALPFHVQTISTSAVTATWNNGGTTLTNAGTYRVMYTCFGK